MSDLSPLAQKALPAAEKLAARDEAQLFTELGLRLKALENDPALAGQFDAAIPHDATEMGLLDDLGPLGKRIFKRLTREAHSLLCDSDADDRKSLVDALGMGKAEVTAALTALLVSSLGAAPLLASVIAAIVISRFLGPTLEEICGAWGESLDKDSAPAGG